MGVPQEKLDQLDRYRQSPVYSEDERLMLQYAEEVTKQVDAGEELYQALSRHFSTEQLVEMNVVIGLANLVNRFIESFKVEIEADQLAAHNQPQAAKQG